MPIQPFPSALRVLPPLLVCGALGACLVGPHYKRPSAPTSPAYKEAAGWVPAQPSDAADRRDWWTVFGDPTLNDLEKRVEVSNQTLASNEAAYREALALVSQDRAALFPTISLTPSASRTGGGANIVGTNAAGAPVSGVTNAYAVGGQASWAPDIWGAVRRTIENARENAQASEATLANARLSAQSEMALDYIQFRELDEQKRILDATVEAYRRTLAITQNKYKVGVAAQSDVLTAETQLASTEANDTDLTQQRAKVEHAIAILAGQTPASLTLTPAPWSLKLPEIPAGVPSALLQRRPDIANTERLAAAANANVGIQVAAYYPTLTLSASGGYQSSAISQLFNASSTLWSVGASVGETVFDAGLRSAKVRGAKAAYDQAVANYRQTVLTAFGQVEDNMAAQRVLADEQVQAKRAADTAARNVVVSTNEYKAGTVDYTTVATAQTTALSAQTTELSVEAYRLSTAVNLIEALGGGWTAPTK